MDKVIDFAAHKAKDDQPEPAHVHHDFCTDHVETFYEFCADYEFDGKTWGCTLWARDPEEAQRKLASVSGGKVLGQLMATVLA